MTKTNEQPKEQAKVYRTLSDIMNAPGRESLPVIAVIAPAIEQIATKTGIIGMVFNDTVALANNPRALAKLPEAERTKNREEMQALGEKVTLTLLGSIGSCMAQYQEILAAINGVTVDELLDRYNTIEIIRMIKALVGDAGFLTYVRELVN